MKSTLLTLSTILIASAVAAADIDAPNPQLQNWGHWRGPLANGVAPTGNPPTNWDETTNVKWKAKIPGTSTATPIVWGDQIILPSAIMTDRQVELPPPPADAPKNPFNIKRPQNIYQFVVMSVDRRTGKTLWQQQVKEDVPHEGHHPDASYASASPTTDGTHIYVSFGSRGVYCFDMQGNQKWSRDLGKMMIFNTFGEGCSPVVHGDSVVINWDHEGGSFIAALDAKTGETNWKVDRDEHTSWATPLVVSYNGRTQVVVNGTNRVRSYDMNTGEEIWQCGGQVRAAIPCPVTDGRLAFVMTGYQGNALFAIPLDSMGDITDTDKIAWKRKEPGTPYVPSPLLYGELLYFNTSNRGLWSCLDANTGNPLIDRKRLEGINNIYASPVGAADRIYVTSREGNTVVLKRGSELEILATNKLDDRFDASAAIVGNQIIMRGNENLYCISAEERVLRDLTRRKKAIMVFPIGDDNSDRLVTPGVNYVLIALNVFVFVVFQGIGANETFTYKYSTVPAEIVGGKDIVTDDQVVVDRTTGQRFQVPGLQPTPVSVYLTLLTSMFMHGGIAHLLGNMWFLWIFGDNVEDRMGHWRYLVFYLLTGIIASLSHVLMNTAGPASMIPSLGASGAISGVMGAYLVLSPNRRVRAIVLRMVTVIPGYVAVGLWFLFQLVSSLGILGGGQEGGIAYAAHIGGFLAGAALAKLFDFGRQPSMPSAR